ncbi:TonB-dependent receptor [Helicobacter anatolicus]|uniref:TonB-dependent receptor n=1 Tax=Helicobacter anatolicus TaxID=2905874 RepID=UPI001E35AE3C|nr:TonB-dependent receptor [Helicobacter anatolicus]MCE3039704.1 TonB-dependent receptor [Helicobacter anatolicus]
MYKKYWPLVFAPFVLTGILIAEETKQLEAIVSTSNKIPTLISEAPGNVSLVDSEQIKKQSSKQISDILDKVASIRVDKNTGYNGRPQVFMRGIPYGTLLMLDGIILNDLEGEFRILQSISPFDIDRIEIVRGAFSSLYGTGGIGGVINFITKMPKKLEMQASLGYGNELVTTQAEKDLVRGYLSLGNVFLDGRLRVRASYSFSSSDGAYRVPAIAKLDSGQTASDVTLQNGANIQNGMEVGWVGRSAYLTQDVRFKAEYDWGENDTTNLILNLSTISENQHSPITKLKDKNGASVFGYATSDDKYYNPFIGSGWAGFRQEYNIVASIGHKHYFDETSFLNVVFSSVNLINYWDDGCNGKNCSGPGRDATNEAKNSYIFGGRGSSSDNYASSNYLDITYTNEINKIHSIVSGIQARLMFARNQRSYVSDFASKYFWQTYDSYWGQDNSAAYTLAAFASWQAKWNKYLSTNLGLRLDYWKNFNMSTIDITSDNPNLQKFDGVNEFFPSPKFAINYSPWKYTAIKGSVGLAFRAPNTRQMFAHAHAGDNQVSNPTLSPEYGAQFDIGIEQRNHYGGVAKIYYYHTEMFNAIYKGGAGTAEDPYKNQNGGRSRFNGVEIEIDQKIYGDLSFGANYTFTKAILLNDPKKPQNNGHQMASIPLHMGGISLNYGGNRGFFGSLQMQGQSDAYTSIENKPVKFGFGNVNKRLIFNFKAGYQFKNNTYLSVSFLNFTNQKFWDYYRGSGASFYVEIGSKFF